jgi:hypothetical protein
MNGRLLAQLGWLAWKESESLLPDPYAWPPRHVEISAETMKESQRLRTLSNQLFYRARRAGFVGESMDEIFGS